MDAHIKILRRAAIALTAPYLPWLLWRGLHIVQTDHRAHNVSFTQYAILELLGYLVIVLLLVDLAICVFRGSLRAARVASWIAAFVVTCFACGIVAKPLFIPASFWFVRLRFYPLRTSIDTFLPVLGHVGVAWAYLLLTSKPVLRARREAGLAASRSR